MYKYFVNKKTARATALAIFLYSYIAVIATTFANTSCRS